MADVILTKLTKRFGSRGAAPVAAVSNLNFHVRDGELLVLVGPSGCGKTTTLRLIAGLEEPTEGEIRIGGRVVNRLPPRARDVAMVFQESSLYPHMTARRNMAFALSMARRNLGRGEIEQRVNRAAEALGIAALLPRKPGMMSGGERQRVALGRALVREPACLLLDEPLSNLDPALRVSMRAEIKALQRRLGLTLIHVTHDREEAMTLGDRIAVMHGGTIHQLGSPPEIYEQPANALVARFFGSPPMNLIVGRIVATVGSGQGDRAMFENGHGLRVSLPRPGHPITRDALLGVRPEATHIENQGVGDGGFTPPPGKEWPAIAITIEQIEWLGDQMNVHGRTGWGELLVSRMKARHGLKPGQAARWSFDPAAVHLFEAGECGRRIS